MWDKFMLGTLTVNGHKRRKTRRLLQGTHIMVSVDMTGIVVSSGKFWLLRCRSLHAESYSLAACIPRNPL
jgi:hypothetical protein